MCLKCREMFMKIYSVRSSLFISWKWQHIVRMGSAPKMESCDFLLVMSDGAPPWQCLPLWIMTMIFLMDNCTGHITQFWVSRSSFGSALIMVVINWIYTRDIGSFWWYLQSQYSVRDVSASRFIFTAQDSVFPHSPLSRLGNLFHKQNKKFYPCINWLP